MPFSIKISTKTGRIPKFRLASRRLPENFVQIFLQQPFRVENEARAKMLVMNQNVAESIAALERDGNDILSITGGALDDTFIPGTNSCQNNEKSAEKKHNSSKFCES